MSRGIFSRILLFHIVFFGFAVLFTEVYLTSVIRDSYVSTLSGELAARISLIERDVQFDDGLGYDELSRQIKALIAARVTVIRENGEVIGDSDSESSRMENHHGRVEVLQALEQGVGSSVRHSDTMGHDFLYVAKRATDAQGNVGVVRLAIPLVEVDRAINSFRMKIILTVAVVLLLTFGLSIYFVRLIRGYLINISEFAHCIAREPSGQQLYFEGAPEFEAITDDLNAMSKRLHKAFSEIEGERQRLEIILKSIPDALLILGERGEIRLASASASEFFGGQPLAGRQYLEVFRSHEVAALVDAARLEGALVTGEVPMDDKWLLVRVSPLPSDETVMILHDITKERQLEAVRKDFIANVSHELKTPISAIKGFTETLLDGALEDRENAGSFLKTIHTHAGRMNTLIDDLMTLSRIELGVLRVEKSTTIVSDAAQSVIDLLGKRAEAKGLALARAITPEGLMVEADRNRLIQILTNLADNAIKFTEKGAVTLGAEHLPDGATVIYVKDTGIGIPQKHLGRLGERFYRVDAGRSRNMGGTGLGLSIVKHLVKAHGWQMRIESAEGRGTTVKIII